MKKGVLKAVALIVALISVISVFSGCSKIEGDNKGAIIDLYMESKVMNLDPATAYTDANAVQILSLIFEGLTRINDNGKVEKALAKEWEITTDEKSGLKKMTIVINTTYWSDSSLVQAGDVAYAWRRILNPEFESSAASMLFCIQGARDAKLGKLSLYDENVGISVLSKNKLQITFEKDADIDEFIYNMASPALVPLRENKISLYEKTWSRSNTDLSTNGPFRVKKFSSEGTEILILERSKYYYLSQDFQTEAIDKFVTPYRLVFHFAEPLDKSVVGSTAETDVATMFDNKELFYVSNLTPSTTGAYTKSELKTTALASTYSYYFNTSVSILANADVRKAMSLALDRTELANRVGTGTKAATGLLPSMIFDYKSGTSFRKACGDTVSSSAATAEAAALIAQSGVNVGSQSLELYYLMDEVNDSYASMQMGYVSKEKAAAQYAKEVWEALGFSIVLKPVRAADFDSVFTSGDYDIVGLDFCALSAYPMATLAQFATPFSGSAKRVFEGDPEYDSSRSETSYCVSTPHVTGYSSEAYDALIEQAYAETDIKEKAKILHQAEQLLMNEAPIVPLLFNSETYAVSGELSGIKVNYFGAKIFTKVELKNYTKYLDE